MAKADLISILRASNPTAKDSELMIFADALAIYAEARENIDANGAVCMHPKTGAPIENPYLAVLRGQAQVIGKLTRIKGGDAMRALGIAG